MSIRRNTVESIQEGTPRLLISDLNRATLDERTKTFHLGDVHFKKVAILGEITSKDMKFLTVDDHTGVVRVYFDESEIEDILNEIDSLMGSDLRVSRVEMSSDAVALATSFLGDLKQARGCLDVGRFEMLDLVHVVGKVSMYKGCLNVFAKSLCKVVEDPGRAKLRWFLEREEKRH